MQSDQGMNIQKALNTALSNIHKNSKVPSLSCST